MRTRRLEAPCFLSTALIAFASLALAGCGGKDTDDVAPGDNSMRGHALRYCAKLQTCAPGAGPPMEECLDGLLKPYADTPPEQKASVEALFASMSECSRLPCVEMTACFNLAAARMMGEIVLENHRKAQEDIDKKSRARPPMPAATPPKGGAAP